MKYLSTFERFISEKKKSEDDGKGKDSETPKGKDVKGQKVEIKTKKPMDYRIQEVKGG